MKTLPAKCGAVVSQLISRKTFKMNSLTGDHIDTFQEITVLWRYFRPQNGLFNGANSHKMQYIKNIFKLISLMEDNIASRNEILWRNGEFKKKLCVKNFLRISILPIYKLVTLVLFCEQTKTSTVDKLHLSRQL